MAVSRSDRSGSRLQRLGEQERKTRVIVSNMRTRQPRHYYIVSNNTKPRVINGWYNQNCNTSSVYKIQGACNCHDATLTLNSRITDKAKTKCLRHTNDDVFSEAAIRTFTDNMVAGCSARWQLVPGVPDLAAGTRKEFLPGSWITG
ncbi:hypothetical protein LSAT2_008961 [Lamellibrachia satsuma]|nr:hypothetical protein LSAT2_008961 [Lamellibrachia satsuma]